MRHFGLDEVLHFGLDELLFCAIAVFWTVDFAHLMRHFGPDDVLPCAIAVCGQLIQPI